MSKYTVKFYEKANGECPIEDFFDTLDVKMRAKILKNLKMYLEEIGPHLREPHSKELKNGIFEFRVKFGSDITRNLYFFWNNGDIIMTNGFVKKTQKTPKRIIELAETYRKDYIERFGE